MTCPKCGGKVRVAYTEHNTETNETYRQRKCTECNYIFYTTESITEETPSFRKNWVKYNYAYMRYRKND